jgi:hypothetical protein
LALANEGDEVELEGIITAILQDDFMIEIKVDNEGVIETYLVKVGQGFDFESIFVGDIIEVKGTFNEDGILVMKELKIQEQEQEQKKEQEGEMEGFFCENESKFHPLGLKIEATYGVDYSTIETYLCGENHVPMGQIKLAIQTAALAEGVEYTEYLDDFQGISWGQVWQELGLKGKPEHGVPFGQIKKMDGETDTDGKIPPGQMKKDGDFNPPGWLKKGKQK